MRRIITLTALALGLTGGVAAADHGRSSVVVRDHRSSGGHADRGHERLSYGNNQRWDRGYHRGSYDRGSVRVVRRPIYANRDNRFYFTGGVSRPLYRPIITYRYRNYYQRPAVIVENYDAVPGYIWTAGQWQWNGNEWLWISGHYELDTAYDDGTAYPGYPPGY